MCANKHCRVQSSSHACLPLTAVCLAALPAQALLPHCFAAQRTAAGTLNELGRYVRVVMRPVSAQGVVGEYSKSDVGPVELDPGELTALPWLLRPVVTPRAPLRP